VDFNTCRANVMQITKKKSTTDIQVVD